jgi:DNA polymerase (family 10)
VQEQVKVRLLKGTESDILADGRLDWPDDILERLDVVIASVHQRHKLDEAAMTDRLRRCFEWPCFKIWGHPLGRLLGRREPFACRLDELFEVAGKTGRVAFEINGDPHRLDMAPELVRKARAHGLKFVLSCDAHATRELGYTEYAVDMARRARLTPADVLNTLPVDGFKAAVRP